MNAAKETAADKDAAQTEVDNALNVLNAAVAKLEKVKDPNQQQPVQPQPEQTKPDKTTPQTEDGQTQRSVWSCSSFGSRCVLCISQTQNNKIIVF